MSIGHNTGGLASYFARIWATQTYLTLRETSKKLLEHVKPAWDLAKRTEEHMKGMVAPGTLFEELGWHYIGPLDGHDLPSLVEVLKRVSSLSGPQILHIRTIKGKGFTPAEEDPIGYHALGKIEPKKEKVEEAVTPAPKPPKYQDVFGQWLCDTAEIDSRLAGITPAMCEGSGMVNFAEQYPDRYFDVAIAEQHAVTLAAGMACDGVKPVVAIYSTFLQRGYDQLIHDVALQNLDVTFAIDRAGLVGQDGATHHGAFDLSYMRCIPNLIIAAPSNENDCRQLLVSAYNHPGPSAVRYPRGEGIGVRMEPELNGLEIGKGEIARQGSGTAIVNFGVMLTEAIKAGDALDATVADMRWVKPLDTALLDALAASHDVLITVEENALAGGAGSAVSEYFAESGVNCEVRHVAIDDRFIDHAGQGETRTDAGLTAEDILNKASPASARLHAQTAAVAL